MSAPSGRRSRSHVWTFPKSGLVDRLVFGRCDFLVIPSYRLSPRSARSVAEYSRSIEKSDSGRAHHSSVLSRTAPAVEIEECQLAIFLDNQAWNELIHVQTPWVKAGMRAHTQAQNIDILEKFDGEEARQRPMFADLMGQLSSNYSMLRRGSTQWLQFASTVHLPVTKGRFGI